MLSMFLESSIRKPEDCSVGAFRTVSMTPWGQYLFLESEATRGATPPALSEKCVFAFGHRTSGRAHLHGMLFDQETAVAINHEGLRLRAICYYLIDWLPDAGLSETAEVLANLHRYYASISEDHLPAALPQPELHPSRVRARAGIVRQS